MNSAYGAARSPLPLTALLAQRAECTPDQTAYTYLDNGEDPGERTTWRELHSAVRARGVALAERAGGNRSAVLMYPTCLEFVRAWLGCATAGLMAAPLQVPTRRHAVERLRRIADDAGTTLVLTTREVRDRVRADFSDMPELAGLDLIATEELATDELATDELATDELATDGLATDGQARALPVPELSDVALLQYTSGSTGSPKGVMVTHANFWANAAETDALWPLGDDGTIVSWLPFFHDMGLLLGVVLPLWSGHPAYLMGPEAFVRRPGRWLEALSRFGGTHSAAPNFAYDLCVAHDSLRGPVDLSRWRAAINGAEPVRTHTVREFTGKFGPYGLDRRAMAPAYGLAENTLKVAGSPPDAEAAAIRLDAEALGQGRILPVTDPTGRGAVVSVMSCGRTVGDTRVRLVDPDTSRAADPDRVAEIWVQGPCVTAGYIGREEESERTFRARIVGEEDAGPFLRTGDMGFVRDGQVFVTGRLKDLIVLKGRNHYPQDLEHSAESGHPLLRPASAAAFAVDTGTGESVVVVLEADSRVLRYAGADEVTAAVREAVRRDHRVAVEDVVLIRRGTLPKTTSGKVRRSTCRAQYEAGTLSLLQARAGHRPPGNAGGSSTR